MSDVSCRKIQELPPQSVLPADLLQSLWSNPALTPDTNETRKTSFRFVAAMPVTTPSPETTLC